MSWENVPTFFQGPNIILGRCWLARAQFHKACKHKKLLSTRKSCLAKTGNQPTFHKVHIVATGALLICLAMKACEIGPREVKVTYQQIVYSVEGLASKIELTQ